MSSTPTSAEPAASELAAFWHVSLPDLAVAYRLGSEQRYGYKMPPVVNIDLRLIHTKSRRLRIVPHRVATVAITLSWRTTLHVDAVRSGAIITAR
jgi:hypothetical protein